MPRAKTKNLSNAFSSSSKVLGFCRFGAFFEIVTRIVHST